MKEPVMCLLHMCSEQDVFDEARFNDTLPLFKESSWEWLSAKSLQVADLPRTVKEKISETKNSQDI